jgi:hypothetical protein
MKIIFKTIFLLLFTFNLSAQKNNKKESDLTYFKPLLERRMLQLEQQKGNINPISYNRLKERYKDIAHGMNSAYQTATVRIANGYLTKGKKIHKKKNGDIKQQITFFEKQALALYQDATQELEVLGIFPDIINIGKSVVEVVKMLEKHLKKVACQRAKAFYTELHWKTYDEIVTEKERAIDFKFLGGKCD